MLLLGAIQAQVSAPVAAGSFDLLATEILTSSQASVTFSSLDTLAAGYQHLQIRIAGRTDRASTSDFIDMRLNGDSGSNYTQHFLSGNGSSVTSGSSLSRTGMAFSRLAGASATASAFGAMVIDLLDAFNSNKYTTARTLGGYATDFIELDSGLWLNTASITSIYLEPGSGSNFITGSRFSLYGIKAA